MNHKRAILLIALVISVLLVHQNVRFLFLNSATALDVAAYLLEEFVPSKTRHTSSKAGMAACLMVRDDNLLLPEWIAYHFTTLPLNDLVVAADLGSTQDVSLITKKYESLLNITVWNASDFVLRFGEIPVPLNDTNHHYLHRQRAFISSCAEYFKHLNKTWVAFVDTDEYITINRAEIRNDSKDQADQAVMKQRRAALQHSPKTVWEALHAANEISPLLPCHGMPRLLYGSLENVTCDNDQSVKDMFHQYDFQYVPTTIRYVQHARKGAFYPSKWGKVLVDVSRLSWDSLGQKPKSSHRPFQECPKPFFGFDESILQVNHYLGSWERYSARSDARRSRLAFEERAYFSDGVSCDDHLWEWFTRFSDRVGSIGRARDLLSVDF
jgi:hypothetical protein